MRIFSLHPYTTDVISFLDYLHLNGNYDLVWDANKPQILFVSEWIYYNQDYFDKFCALFNVAKIKIFLAYEAISPDFNIFDYAIGFDDKLQNDDRFIRLMSPFNLYKSFGSGVHSKRFITEITNSIQTIKQAKIELAGKTAFCNFLYSNPNAHPMRDKLFFEISKYKKVDGLGLHLNNVNIAGTGFVGHSLECVPIKRKYKFSIASENAVYSGYTSEKLLTSLEAHTVPIYFGNPNVKDDINQDAFINVNDFNSLESLRDYIREVDNDDELWCKYVSAPWLTPEQIVVHKERDEVFKKKMEVLLTGDIEGKERLAEGTHQSRYRTFLFNSIEASPLLSSKMAIKRWLRRHGLLK